MTTIVIIEIKQKLKTLNRKTPSKRGCKKTNPIVRNIYKKMQENVRNILQELHILLTPDQEHKNVFQDTPVAGFRNDKSLKDHLVRAKLPNVEIRGRSELCGKGNYQVCVFICDTDTFSTKACGETFKIQSGILNCNSQKVVYLLK